MPAGPYPFGFPTTHNAALSVNAKLWGPVDEQAGCDSLPSESDLETFSGIPLRLFSSDETIEVFS